MPPGPLGLVNCSHRMGDRSSHGLKTFAIVGPNQTFRDLLQVIKIQRITNPVGIAVQKRRLALVIVNQISVGFVAGRQGGVKIIRSNPKFFDRDRRRQL